MRRAAIAGSSAVLPGAAGEAGAADMLPIVPHGWADPPHGWSYAGCMSNYARRERLLLVDLLEAVGPDASTYESFKTADVNERDLMHQHIQAVCQAKMGSREGMGILEMAILGPHDQSGFKEFLDMHS